ncbi:uncharacterized protein LOC103313175 [Tribolium castaneum]|uniref:Uncharacterized protein n=1 Tax=Tribolium castaneum TaxID=7070 RepID=D6WML1_TRICA|nr:PREDICTED: uncharacterized protein LOC103313175 [Tribolium castaneum]EFA03283.1 hypothetical protein TcasGA2_TC013219 [Tribolium castaneum]|eukprot:XP_008193962.1 PREDICTED: uncharacterized protein LOC103313175 [Tribolium castaneum]
MSEPMQLKKKEVLPKLPCEFLTPNDSKDPSYTNLEVPYRVICRQRYQKAGTQQRLQFLREIRRQEISQSKALSGVRIHRVFLNPVLVPANPVEIVKLTPKQKFKLEQLLNE